MYSFAPGELLTGGLRGPATAPFNFSDAICPPVTEVMFPYEYQPGEPYLPQIVPPSQLFTLNPAFSSCFLYSGTCYDPLYVLTPESVLTPFTTPAQNGDNIPTTALPGSSLSSPTPSVTVSYTSPGTISFTTALVVGSQTEKDPVLDSSTLNPSIASSYVQIVPSEVDTQQGSIITKTTGASGKMIISTTAIDPGLSTFTTHPSTPDVIVQGQPISLGSPHSTSVLKC